MPCPLPASPPILTANAGSGRDSQQVPRKGRAMEKALSYGALGVAALMSLIFLLDLVVGKPFGNGEMFGSPFLVVDLFGLVASGIVAYLAVNAARDLT